MQPHEGYAGGVGVAGAVTQADRDVLAAVDQAVEGDHPRGHGRAVGQAQRQPHVTAYDGSRALGQALDAHAGTSVASS